MSDNNNDDSRRYRIEDFIKNFPFPTIRPKQLEILMQITDALNAGYRIIILEAPTGFGKSAVAISMAKTLGSSYICSKTKVLQDQYAQDFPFLKAVKGMNEFTCAAKEDLLLSGKYECIKCKEAGNENNKYYACPHLSATYGLCRQGYPGYAHDFQSCKDDGGLCEYRSRSSGRDRDSISEYPDICHTDDSASSEFHRKCCRYMVHLEDYACTGRISPDRIEAYRQYSTDSSKGISGWVHLQNLKKEVLDMRKKEFVPCPYYAQLNVGKTAKHSIFNYSNFQLFLRINPSYTALHPRILLILDEGHEIENEAIKHVSISINAKEIGSFVSPTVIHHCPYGYNDSIKDKWIPWLENLADRIADTTPDYDSKEIQQDASDYIEKIKRAIDYMKANPDNWIISDIQRGNHPKRKKKSKKSESGLDALWGQSGKTQEPIDSRIFKIEFKPLSISTLCRKLFEKCGITLIMSATISDVNIFCKNIGLDIEKDKVKFIQTDSDFPPEKRPIYQCNTVYLNYDALQKEENQRKIAFEADRIMDLHKNQKGIIHTTSYSQVQFIKKFLSPKRLIHTDPVNFENRDNLDGKADHVIQRHFESKEPTVLISPSLNTGIDLSDDRARFAIIVKVPYPSKGDRWTDVRREKDSAWYNWLTALKLVQAYGRTCRNKDDWAITYILDSGFTGFVSKNGMPKWFIEAIK